MIRRLAPGDAALAFAALRELRPTSPFMASLDTFQAFLEEAGRESYALVGSFEEGRREAVAVAGYRVMTMLYVGRLLYVDDLSTLPESRGRGHAGAIRRDAAELHLDGGTGLARFAAHRQYLIPTPIESLTKWFNPSEARRRKTASGRGVSQPVRFRWVNETNGSRIKHGLNITAHHFSKELP